VSVDLLRKRKLIYWRSLTLDTWGDERVHGALSDESFFLPPDDGGIAAIAEREHIQLAIANMPQDYAVALVLNAAQGLSYQEVAARVGISPNAAATRISRAKKLFVEYYQRVSHAFCDPRLEAGSSAEDRGSAMRSTSKRSYSSGISIPKPLA
jgi:RNA polymerase sigma-70 factor (ECF subfamily)